ncbi:protein phosphatase 2C domain-containing protein [Nodosilinea sp. LEGE 07088]|uniref:protein phosphatase 2C domain-containing protein n=1 Tax=Nodosilinea sp. LEGE 07088 TaxID=2777968 RepID=UPI0028BE60B8|nr:protein phosphatase 2C domain-containing protein [Nodosilinea sp. LEGE 07088]
MGNRPLTHSPSPLVAGRFLVWHGDQKSAVGAHRIWLDTRPDTPPPALDRVPPVVMPYLKLFHLAHHIPRPYAYLSREQTGLETEVLLLDAAPIGTRLNDQTTPWKTEAALLPSLPQVWAQGSALRQLNWLRQIAMMWTALADQGVTATLLALDELRTDGALLRLTTLVTDKAPLTLVDLGRRWQELVATAQPPMKGYLDWLTHALAEGRITAAETLIAELEGAIQALAQGLLVTVDWTADTDQGPTRDRNEDACHPEKLSYQQRLTSKTVSVETPPLLLVCDGIGGHEQGNVASQTAIKLLQQELEPLTQQCNLPPAAVAQRLNQALILANDTLSTRNNDEQRSARARMGTTVVLALVHFPYVAIAHIGDSRAYRVSAQTCYQITVDDDVASREAQMGYALYSEAVQLPSGGALIQALGISESGYLYPTVQHLLLDDAAVLLLCSDGLSDYDRVDALAPHLVAPLATTATPLSAPVAELIQRANQLNGHDNVTVGLMRFAPQTKTLPTLPARSLQQADAPSHSDLPPPTPVLTAQTTNTLTVAPADAPQPRSKVAWVPFFGGLIAVLATLAAVGFGLSRRQLAPVPFQPLARQWAIAPLAGQPLPSNALAATANVPVGSFWQAENGAGLGADRDPLRLSQRPTSIAESTAMPPVAIGSILRVISRQTAADNTDWVQLQVCSIPSGISLDQLPQEVDQETNSDQPMTAPVAPDLTQRLSAPGDKGWVQARQLYAATAFLDLVTPAQAGRCGP